MRSPRTFRQALTRVAHRPYSLHGFTCAQDSKNAADTRQFNTIAPRPWQYEPSQSSFTWLHSKAVTTIGVVERPALAQRSRNSMADRAAKCRREPRRCRADPQHEFTVRLIRYTHERLRRSGISTTMRTLRERVWILSSRRAVRKVINRCVNCRRHAAKTVTTPATCLSEDRVRDADVFEVTGVDYAGPLYLRDGTKAWICLFTCAIYRPVHLELKISIGDIVLVENDNTKRLDWPLARVIDLVKDRDGIVQVAKVKTATGELMRPVQGLLILEESDPIDDKEQIADQDLTPIIPSSDFISDSPPTVSDNQPIILEEKQQQFTRSGRAVKKPTRFKDYAMRVLALIAGWLSTRCDNSHRPRRRRGQPRIRFKRTSDADAAAQSRTHSLNHTDTRLHTQERQSTREVLTGVECRQWPLVTIAAGLTFSLAWAATGTHSSRSRNYQTITIMNAYTIHHIFRVEHNGVLTTGLIPSLGGRGPTRSTCICWNRASGWIHVVSIDPKPTPSD
ncbi:unnamed protein product [Trichogramma brassicae]|uniref:DUF5641 domain-containing protein n=1 Tax=Trichogramma brassicae TaxID=86971 RepID=A0A6H5I098_9HYME|nr:unnamed protein product [Trichogramma brassicae]